MRFVSAFFRVTSSNPSRSLGVTWVDIILVNMTCLIPPPYTPFNGSLNPIYFFLFFFKIIMHQLVKLTDPMTFTAGNLFPSHSCIGWSDSSPHWDLNLGPQIERRTTYQLSYCSPQKSNYSCKADRFQEIGIGLAYCPCKANIHEVIRLGDWALGHTCWWYWLLPGPWLKFTRMWEIAMVNCIPIWHVHHHL